jgi:CRISPR-associated exonuclease Cas4
MKPFSVSEQEFLNVGDLKQSAYCPRIPYFNRFLGLKTTPTFLMERGASQEKEFDQRQKRHKNYRFGMEQAQRHLHVCVVSERYKLTGIIDLVLEGQNDIIVVDCKGAKRFPGENHYVQIGAYGLLAEERFHKPCRKGFLYYSEGKQWVEITIDDNLRQKVLELIEQVEGVVNRGIFPEAALQIAKCRNCEFLNFCGDRW